MGPKDYQTKQTETKNTKTHSNLNDKIKRQRQTTLKQRDKNPDIQWKQYNNLQQTFILQQIFQQARKEWNDTFKVLNENKNFQPQVYFSQNYHLDLKEV